MPLDDSRLVANVLAGRHEAVRELFERAFPSVRRLAQGYGELEAQEAEAAAVEGLALGLVVLPELSEPSRVRAWLLTVARHHCLRQSAKKGGGPLEQLAAARPDVSLAPDPGTAEAKARIAQGVIENLADPLERDAARLFYKESRHDAATIAGMLGVEPAVVTAALERVRARLKLHLAAMLIARRLGPGASAPGPDDAHVRLDTWKRILAGLPVEGEARFARHFAGDCRVCARLLADQRVVDALDGEADVALLALGTLPPRSVSTQFARLMRRLQLEARLSGRRELLFQARSSRLLPLGLAAGLAVLALSVLAFQRVPQRSASADERSVVELSFAVVPGVPNESYPNDRVFMLRFSLARTSFVSLLRMDDRGHVELIAQPGRLGPGPHDLSVNHMTAAVTLAELNGRQRFVVVASESPLGAMQLRQLLDAVASGDRGVFEGVSVDWFDAVVLPASE